MSLVHGDLRQGASLSSSARKSGASRPVVFFIIAILAIVLFSLSFALGRISLSATASAALGPFGGFSFLSQVGHLISSPDRELIGEEEDRINILLIGMGGEGHDGPYLSDTLILVSIRPSDSSVAMMSIPRDLLVPVPDLGWRKINAVNSIGELRNPGNGGNLTRTTVEEVFGLSIPYYVRIDFNGFKHIIDAVGGVDVHVDRSFTDTTYPTNNYGVQTIRFTQGWHHMEGEQALQFARSRHGNNGEGGDFARSQRQQKVITALKDKLTSAKTFRNPATIVDTLAALQANVATNMHVGTILRLAKMGQEIDRENILHHGLDNRPDGELVDSVVEGAYVLLPRRNDWGLLRNVAANVFEDAVPAPEAAATPPPPPQQAAHTIQSEKPSVEILNGSGVSGVARQVSERLTALGFSVVRIGNADSFSYTETHVYDMTDGKKSASLSGISSVFSDDDTEYHALSEAQSQKQTSAADFLIILGP